MELITLHTHSSYCPHADSSLADMVAAAYKAGITTMGVTEHYPLTTTIDPEQIDCMPKERVGEYVAEIEFLRHRYPTMDILTGCELDWLGKDEDRNLTEEDMCLFEYILLSVHFIDAWGFDNPDLIDRWQLMGVDNVWKRYFEIWCDAASSKVRANAMAHPDLVKKFGFMPSFDPTKLYKDAVEACQAGGRMVEVNTSGFDYPCKEMYPHVDMLRQFRRANIPCTIGTDAHKVAHIDRYIRDGYKLMYEAGYREVTVPMHGGGYRTINMDQLR